VATTKTYFGQTREQNNNIVIRTHKQNIPWGESGRDVFNILQKYSRSNHYLVLINKNSHQIAYLIGSEPAHVSSPTIHLPLTEKNWKVAVITNFESLMNL
jgi:hypothetical protein